MDKSKLTQLAANERDFNCQYNYQRAGLALAEVISVSKRKSHCSSWVQGRVAAFPLDLFALLFFLNTLCFVAPLLSCEKIEEGSCEIKVFDCGQGNLVAAKHLGEAVILDAGQKAYKTSVDFAYHLEGESSSENNWAVVTEKKKLVNLLLKGNRKAKKEKEIDWKKKKEFQERAKLSKTDLIRNVKAFIEGTTLNTIFISHPDEDHYSLVPELNLPADQIVLGGRYELYNKKFKVYALKNYKGEHRCLKTCNKSEYCLGPLDVNIGVNDFEERAIGFKEKGSPYVETLSINAGGANGKLADKNKDSMVIKISHNGQSMLFLGDAEKATLESIEKSELKSDSLLLAHHGSETNGSITKELLEAIQPKICVISAGFEHHHPSYTAIKILLDYFARNKEGQKYRVRCHYVTFFDDNKQLKSIVTNAPIFTTADNGSISLFLSDGDKFIVKTSRNFKPDCGVTISDKGGSESYALATNSDEVCNKNEMVSINGGKNIFETFDNTDNIIYISKRANKEKSKQGYYYKFDTDLYYKLTPTKYGDQDESSSDD